MLVLAFAKGCARTPAAPSLLGSWGGDHIELTVASPTSHVELDCAHGDFQGPVMSSSFTSVGTLVQQHGGPGVGETHPATFEGSVSGDTMTLTIRVTDTGGLFGRFMLARGVPGRVVKCL